MKKDEYNSKLDHIIQDPSKFKPLTRNPVPDLKVKVNDLIHSANSQSSTKQFNPIIGEYKPGYIYGTVKTHKNGNPLRPIVSQIPTPTYETSKKLN